MEFPDYVAPHVKETLLRAWGFEPPPVPHYEIRFPDDTEHKNIKQWVVKNGFRFLRERGSWVRPVGESQFI